MHALIDYLTEPIVWALPFFGLFIAIEYLGLRWVAQHDTSHRKDRTTSASLTDSATSVSMGIGYLGVAGLFHAASLIGYSAIYQAVPWKLPADAWYTWLLLFFAVDTLWYGVHRFSHRVRIAWAAHQAHHSSEHFNFSTALRQKWNLWFETLAWTPLPLLGIPPWMIYVGFSLNLICQFLVHTESVDRLPRVVEFLFNTPSHHRVHHGSDPEYLDKNYGGILIIWDRLFGTYAEEKHRPTYGLTTPVDTHNLLKLQFHEYVSMLGDLRRAGSLREVLGYTFGPPGWNPAAGRDASGADRKALPR
ncbi:sterol desaturase family protein [Nocardia sp. NBC_01327]|uniref:sterol desaturase family protein n=1 Tax=Nocardia sp. NBC_01327 TaxID=2903593 RepID=UPI002E1105D3|nr:sterol desaturase family protein [Nocardia sp. NBC_01327]